MADGWPSTFSDPPWPQVDLGQSDNINHLSPNWEAACASAYRNRGGQRLDLDDRHTNNAVGGRLQQFPGKGGLQEIGVNTTGRYVRLDMTAYASQWGDSLYELGVYGTTGNNGGGGGTLLSQGHPATARRTRAPASPLLPTQWTATRASADPAPSPTPPWLHVDPAATHRQERGPHLGDGLRERLPNPDIHQRHDVDDCLLDNRRYRRVQTLNVPGFGQHVRVYGTARATRWGYSLWKFQVSGA